VQRAASRAARLIPALALLSALGAARAQQPTPADSAVPNFRATLAGHAVLPAQSFIAAPKDAPADLKMSGKFTTGSRVEQAGTVEGRSGGRPTGVSLPFKGQPLQGHSGIQHMPDGSFWVITDNGAGSKANSPDFMLYLNHYKVDFKSGQLQRLATVFLHDPDKKVPFRIVQEGSATRYLTGSDFDPESFQITADALWIGEEFGPYLIKADLKGRVLGVFETLVDGKRVRSPDHPSVVTPGAPGGKVAFEARRSKGYEGMAASPDGSKLYALLEGPLWKETEQAYEQVDGKEALRVLEFDTRQAAWTGRSWFYPLEANGHAIGDFNLVDMQSAADGSHAVGLVIERDNGEGTADRACPAGTKAANCFDDIARFKRVYKIAFGNDNVGQPVRKIGYIDLMAIQDPARLARKPLNGDVFTFPFFTIENVDAVDARHIVVGNDNNLPYSSSREPNRADDNELILLEVSDFMQAR